MGVFFPFKTFWRKRTGRQCLRLGQLWHEGCQLGRVGVSELPEEPVSENLGNWALKSQMQEGR